jgi:hypothetical protein
VDGDIEAEQLDEGFVLAEAEKVGKVPGVVLGWVDGWNFALTVDVTEDSSGNSGKFGDAGLLRQCGVIGSKLRD